MAAETLSVIVVDDNEDVRRVMTLAFELDGRAEVVATGKDARDAIWLAAIHQPDAILLDVRMPEMDGLAALPAIRREAPATKVMLFSVLDEDLMRPKLRAANADGYVSKATSPTTIVERITELCRGESGPPES